MGLIQSFISINFNIIYMLIQKIIERFYVFQSIHV